MRQRIDQRSGGTRVWVWVLVALLVGLGLSGSVVRCQAEEGTREIIVEPAVVEVPPVVEDEPEVEGSPRPAAAVVEVPPVVDDEPEVPEVMGSPP